MMYTSPHETSCVNEALGMSYQIGKYMWCEPSYVLRAFAEWIFCVRASWKRSVKCIVVHCLPHDSPSTLQPHIGTDLQRFLHPLLKQYDKNLDVKNLDITNDML